MDGFQDNIKNWVHIDGEIKSLNDQIKTLRATKNSLNSDIFDFVQTNNLSTSTIKISDGKLKFAQTKQTSPITLQFLESCLREIISDDEKVSSIMTHIKEKREVKFIHDIKRFYDN